MKKDISPGLGKGQFLIQRTVVVRLQQLVRPSPLRSRPPKVELKDKTIQRKKKKYWRKYLCRIKRKGAKWIEGASH